MSKVLNQKFFNRPTLSVARGLLGKYLCRKYRGKVICRMITEVEAYDGFKDKASHAHRGETKRNKAMFGEAGYWYVYFTYGMHWMLNIVTGKRGYPAAVLIRGVAAPQKRGARFVLAKARREPRRRREGINGPARVTKCFKIGKSFNGKPANRQTGLWIATLPNAGRLEIRRSSRIGVNYAGSIWANKKYRFYLEKI